MSVKYKQVVIATLHALIFRGLTYVNATLVLKGMEQLNVKVSTFLSIKIEAKKLTSTSINFKMRTYKFQTIFKGEFSINTCLYYEIINYHYTIDMNRNN